MYSFFVTSMITCPKVTVIDKVANELYRLILGEIVLMNPHIHQQNVEQFFFTKMLAIYIHQSSLDR